MQLVYGQDSYVYYGRNKLVEALTREKGSLLIIILARKNRFYQCFVNFFKKIKVEVLLYQKMTSLYSETLFFVHEI